MCVCACACVCMRVCVCVTSTIYFEGISPVSLLLFLNVGEEKRPSNCLSQINVIEENIYITTYKCQFHPLLDAHTQHHQVECPLYQIVP